MVTQFQPSVCKTWIRRGLAAGAALFFVVLLALLVSALLAAVGDDLGRAVSLVIALIAFLALFADVALLVALYGWILYHYLSEVETAQRELAGEMEEAE